MSAKTKQLITYAAAVTVTLLLLGCASRPSQKAEQVVKRPVLSKVALVEVLPPPRLTVENRGSAWGLLAFPGYIVQRNSDDNKSNKLTMALRSQALSLGDEMTVALREELVRAGFTVELIKNVKRLADDPDSIDYQNIKTDADAIIGARYIKAGLYSGQFSSNYIPRLNIDFEVISASDKSELHSQSIYYGADAKKRAEDQVPADEKYAYGSFDQAMEKQGEVAESFRIGVREIAVLAARQIQKNGR